MFFFIFSCLLLALSINEASRQLVGFDVMSHKSEVFVDVSE